MKKLLTLLSVLTITGTSLPSIIAASNYENQNLNTEIKNYYKIGIQNLENEINYYFKLISQVKESYFNFSENKDNFILTMGEQEYYNKIKEINKYYTNYLNRITTLRNELERLKKVIENQKEN